MLTHDLDKPRACLHLHSRDGYDDCGSHRYLRIDWTHTGQKKTKTNALEEPNVVSYQ
jgi:hypothetical protein